MKKYFQFFLSKSFFLTPSIYTQNDPETLNVINSLKEFENILKTPLPIYLGPEKNFYVFIFEKKFSKNVKFFKGTTLKKQFSKIFKNKDVKVFF